MGFSIDELLAEADQEIKALTKKASTDKAASNAGQPFSDDEPVKFAAFLADFAEENVESAQVKKAEEAPSETVVEKVAHALAILESLANIEQIHKMALFQEKAAAAGYNAEQIEKFLEKQALRPFSLSPSQRKALLAVAGLGGAGAAGATLGHHAGETKGKEEGYVAGVKDYDTALKNLSGYNE
jgi:hypothetical protein